MKAKWKNAIVIAAAMLVFFPLAHDGSYGSIGLWSRLPDAFWLAAFPSVLFVAFEWANRTLFPEIQQRFLRMLCVAGVSAALSVFVCVALVVSWFGNAEDRFTVKLKDMPNQPSEATR